MKTLQDVENLAADRIREVREEISALLREVPFSEPYTNYEHQRRECISRALGTLNLIASRIEKASILASLTENSR